MDWQDLFIGVYVIECKSFGSFHVGLSLINIVSGYRFHGSCSSWYNTTPFSRGDGHCPWSEFDDIPELAPEIAISGPIVAIFIAVDGSEKWRKWEWERTSRVITIHRVCLSGCSWIKKAQTARRDTNWVTVLIRTQDPSPFISERQSSSSIMIDVALLRLWWEMMGWILVVLSNQAIYVEESVELGLKLGVVTIVRFVGVILMKGRVWKRKCTVSKTGSF